MTEWEELVIYVSEMKKAFYSKLNDHIYVIEQQSNRIDEQGQMIHELAWQLRDLRNTVREMSSKQTCECKKYENHIIEKMINSEEAIKLKSGLKLSSTAYNLVEKEEQEKIYEPIDFKLEPKRRDWHQGQNATQNATENITKKIENNKPQIKSQLLEQTNENKTKPSVAKKPKSISTINESFKLFGLNSKSDEKSKSRTIFYISHEDDDADGDDEENVELRVKEITKKHRNSQRGSSRVLCSIMPDIEEEYIPQLIEKTESKYLKRLANEIVFDGSENNNNNIDKKNLPSRSSL